MITRAQIEAEIYELTSEIDRRIAAVRGIFAQVAELRSQTDLLKKLLALRSEVEPNAQLLSSIFVGFVRNETDAPTPICALTWSGSSELPEDMRIQFKREWRSLLPSDLLAYFSDLLADWMQRIRSDPAMLLAGIRELSVGPVRAMDETTVRSSELTRLLDDRLGDFDVYPR